MVTERDKRAWQPAMVAGHRGRTSNLILETGNKVGYEGRTESNKTRAENKRNIAFATFEIRTTRVTVSFPPCTLRAKGWLKTRKTTSAASPETGCTRLSKKKPHPKVRLVH